MPIGAILSKLIGGKLLEGVESVANIADKFIQTKEEKDAFALELLKAKSDIELKSSILEKDIDEMYLKDIQDARSANARIQESDNASWLSKNVLYLLALGVTLGFFGLLGYMLKFDVPTANKDILNIMLGSLGTAWISIVGYFFGSSAGSKVAGDSIRKIAENK